MSTGEAFAVLGLSPRATPSELKSAYRALVKAWHPDRYVDLPDSRQEAEDRLRKINLAYRVLQDHVARRSAWEQEMLQEDRIPARAEVKTPVEALVPRERSRGWLKVVAGAGGVAVVAAALVGVGYRYKRNVAGLGNSFWVAKAGPVVKERGEGGKVTAATPVPVVVAPKPVSVVPTPVAVVPVAAPTPPVVVAANPVAVVPTPKPVAAVSKPVPVVPKAMPVVAKPAPVASKPVTVVPKAVPVVENPAPVASKPVTVVPKAVPVAPKPVAVAPKPVAVAATPKPVIASPKPTAAAAVTPKPAVVVPKSAAVTPKAVAAPPKPVVAAKPATEGVGALKKPAPSDPRATVVPRAPVVPGLAGLSESDRKSVESACSSTASSKDAAAYRGCVLRELKAKPRAIHLR